MNVQFGGHSGHFRPFTVSVKGSTLPETAHPGLGQGNGTESWDSHVSSQLLSARLLRGGAAAGPGPGRPVFSTNRKDGRLLGDKTKQFKERDLIIRHTKPRLAGPLARTRKVT